MSAEDGFEAELSDMAGAITKTLVGVWPQCLKKYQVSDEQMCAIAMHALLINVTGILGRVGFTWKEVTEVHNDLRNVLDSAILNHTPPKK